MIERINGVEYDGNLVHFHYHVMFSKRIIEKAKLLSIEWHKFLSNSGYRAINEPREKVMCFFSITRYMDKPSYTRPIEPQYLEQLIDYFIEFELDQGGNSISLIKFLADNDLDNTITAHKSYSSLESFLYNLSLV